MPTVRIAFRVLWCLTFALIHEVVFYLTLFPLGLILTPLAILMAREQVSPITGHQILNAPRCLWLFGNDEDGFAPAWYSQYRADLNPAVRMFVWGAWRNPVNNLRFVRWLYAPPVLGQVRMVEWRGWLVLWQGWRTRIVSPGWKLTVGFKYQPEDVTQACTDWRRFGVGFGIRYVR